MSVINAARVILYRCHEKGLEILLVNHDLKNDPDVWGIPSITLGNAEALPIIELESTEEDGSQIRTIAIEADWHDIPSVRGLLRHDVKLVKRSIKKRIPSLEKGTYFTIKEAFKKVMPHEYAALKELKDIVFDRNLATNI